MADNGSIGANGSNNNGFPRDTQYEELHSALTQEKKDLENRLADIDQDLAVLIFAKLRNDWKTKATFSFLTLALSSSFRSCKG